MSKSTVMVLCTTLLLTACGPPSEEPSAEEAFLRLGKHGYTRQDVRRVFDSYPLAVKMQYVNGGEPNLEAFARFMAEEAALSVAAREEGLAERPEIETILRWQEDRLLAQAYVRERVYPRVVSEEELASRYDELRPRFTRPAAVHVRHLLITPAPNEVLYNESGDDATTEEEAAAKVARVQSELKAGRSLEELARELSEDRTAPQGGDLGWVSRDELVEEVAAHLDALPLGQVEGPIRSAYGDHFVEILERREESSISFQSVKWDLLSEAVAGRGESVEVLVGQEREALLTSDQIAVP